MARVTAVTIGLVAVSATVISVASATSASSSLGDGDYTLVLPGVGDFQFSIDSASGDEKVLALAAPEGYTVVDDDPDKASWRRAVSVEVEVKSDKIEGEYDWSDGEMQLALPGGWIVVTPPDADGNFTVVASGDWYAFGSGDEWVVANAPLLELADVFYRVEASANGFEIKVIDTPDDDFSSDLDDDDDGDDDDGDDDDGDDDDDDGDDDDGDDDDGDDDGDESEGRDRSEDVRADTGGGNDDGGKNDTDKGGSKGGAEPEHEDD